MKTQALPSLFKGFRFPAESIGHCMWLYFRFSLRFRDVEEILAERGVVVTYETIRLWCLKFGQVYANQLKHLRPKTGDMWHLGAVKK
jgi:putative transposase